MRITKNLKKLKCTKCLKIKILRDFHKIYSGKYCLNRCKICTCKEINEKKLKIKKECYKAYGNKCKCCNEKEFDFLVIDHIGGRNKRIERDKRKHKYGYYEYLRLKKLNYPKDKYQLLCMNCNFAIRGGKICPHKKK